LFTAYILKEEATLLEKSANPLERGLAVCGAKNVKKTDEKKKCSKTFNSVVQCSKFIH
jgi:hypothetical protein